MANQYQEPCTYEIEMGGRKRGAFPRSSLLLEDCRSRGDSSPLLVASILADVSAVSCVQAYPESTVLPCVCGGGCSNLAGSLAKRWALLRSQTADSNRKPRRESCGLTNGTWNLGGRGCARHPAHRGWSAQRPARLCTRLPPGTSVGECGTYCCTTLSLPYHSHEMSLHAMTNVAVGDLAAIACTG